MNNKQMTLYTIYSRRVANELEKLGFPIVKMSKNRKNEKYWVYYFEDGIEFRNALRPLISK